MRLMHYSQGNQHKENFFRLQTFFAQDNYFNIKSGSMHPETYQQMVGWTGKGLEYCHNMD